MIEWGAATRDDMLCIAVRDDPEDGEFRLLTGRPAGVRLPLEIAGEMEDLIALVAAPPTWQANVQFVAMSGDGEIALIGPGWRGERIPGAGYHGPESFGIGRMSSLSVRDDHLFALGYGGQVYLKEGPDANWRYLAADFPRSDHDSTVFYSALRSNSGYFFGGELSARTKFSDDLLNANAAGDAMRVFDLLVKEGRPNYGVLWHLGREGWRQIELPTNEQVFFLEPFNHGTLIVAVQATFLLIGEDQLVDAPVAFDAPVRGLMRLGGGLCALSGGMVLALPGTEIAVGYEGPVPDPDEVFCAAASDGALYAFDDTKVYRNAGSGWLTLDVAWPEAS
jgi:hypothetical protein